MSSASQEALAKQSITANQKTYSNINECFEALESGEVDYVICDSHGRRLPRTPDERGLLCRCARGALDAWCCGPLVQ